MAAVSDSTTIFTPDFQAGEWWIRPTLNRLERDGETVQVEPRSMSVLVDLADHAGDLRSKRRLLHVVWGNAFVSDDVLTHAIYELRKAFGDDPRHPEYIETIPRSGYRLIAPVLRPTDLAAELGNGSFHYETLERLGGGGMGVVYRATDTKLDRQVALKFLPAEMSDDRIARERFLREAKAAARLDHPNLATVHDIGEDPEGRTFIAMAFYDGETIKRKIESAAEKGSRIPIPECLDLAEQIARGLAAAHAQGIIHRDIKPANVMVTVDGQAKIVDFGLAKLAGTTSLTRAGHTPGTVAYMSPEQLLNSNVDHRTDLWALGVVLYEMISGTRPFAGDSDGSVIQAIISESPDPLLDLRPDCPSVVGNIVAALLKKEPEKRLGDAAEVADRLADARFSSDLTETMPGALAASQRTIEESEDPARAPDLYRKRIIPIALATIAALGGLTLLGLWITDKLENRVPVIGRPLQITDTPDWEADSAISPDGGLVAYSTNKAGNADIWLVDARGGNPLQLTTHPSTDRMPAWYPDGSALAFVSDRGGEPAIWKIPRLGGSPTMLVQGASNPAISPDGTRIAYSKQLTPRDWRIAIADLRTPRESVLLTGSGDGLWDHQDPAWSPDGSRICYSDGYNLWLVSANGGRARPLTSIASGDIEPTWSSDGRFVYFASYREGTLALWRVKASGGSPQRLTVGTGPERHPSVSRQGGRLVYSTFNDDTDIVLLDLNTGEERLVPGPRSETSPALSPDGSSVAYVSDRWGAYNLWLQPLEGTRPLGAAQRINDEEPTSSNLAYSPDGHWIAYQRREGDQREVWVVAATGGVPVRFSDGTGVDRHPAWSPDGSSLSYVSYREDRYELRVAPIQNGLRTGSPVKIETGLKTMMHPTWSWDGQKIALIGSLNHESEVWILPAEGALEPKQVTFGADPHFVAWLPSTGSLLVSAKWDGLKLSLREVDADLGQIQLPRWPIDFGNDAVGGEFDLDARGRTLAFTREEWRGDVWLLETAAEAY